MYMYLTGNLTASGTGRLRVRRRLTGRLQVEPAPEVLLVLPGWRSTQ